MTLTGKDFDQIAHLSMFSFTEEEARLMLDDLNQLLQEAEKLPETESLETIVSEFGEMREDIPVNHPDPKKIIENSPNVSEGYIRAKKMGNN